MMPSFNFKKPNQSLPYVLTIFFTLGTGFTSANAAGTCLSREAQFSGRVIRQMPSAEDQVCLVKITLSHFNPSLICPLHIEEAESRLIRDPGCNFKPGTELSGVLTKPAHHSAAQDANGFLSID